MARFGILTSARPGFWSWEGGCWLALFLLGVGVQAPAAAQVDPPAYGADVGSASAQPGEVVQLPVYLESKDPVRGVFVVFTYDANRLKYLSYVVAGSPVADMDPLSVMFLTPGNGEGTFAFFPERFASESYRVPPGEHVHIGYLRFQILATADTGPAAVTLVRTINATAGGSQISVDQSGSGGDASVAIQLSDLGAGSVEVLEPQGSRPVRDLTCYQYLDRVQLRFQPTEAYDSIEIREDGELKSTLAGDATAWGSTLSSLHAHTYSVTAVKGGKRSIPADCELFAVRPAAPPVNELTCLFGGALTWSNPDVFEHIVVLRDGSPIATLPGSSTSFTDENVSTALTLYTVITEVGGYRSPETTCVANGIWIMEAGDVLAPAGATRVTVPIYVTTATPIQGYDVYLGIDTSIFSLHRDIDLSLQGAVGNPNPEYFLMGISGAIPGAPACGMLWDFHAPAEPEKDLPPGIRQQVVSFPFDVAQTVEEGVDYPVTFQGGSCSLRGAITQRVDLYLPGQIRFGAGPVAPVENLIGEAVEPGDPETGEGGGAAQASTRDIHLDWRNGGRYDAVRILRNGEPIAELPGAATGFVDADLPGGLYSYKVAGLLGPDSSFPRRTLVSTFTPPGAFLRGDANRDGTINIADPVKTLRYLFLGNETLPCEDAADADDDGVLRISDPITTLGFLFNGTGVIRAPGARFAWFDPTPDGLGCADK